MKIVVLSGSPHRHGSTARLVDCFLKGAEEAGHEAVRFDTAFLNVHPCNACDACQGENGKCVYQDDMQKVAEALAQSDCVVLATPIYYYGINAQLKTVIDRFYSIEASIRRNQKAAFITAMGDEDPDTVIPANESYRAIVSWMGWKDCGIVNAFDCSGPEDLKKADCEQKAYELGRDI